MLFRVIITNFELRELVLLQWTMDGKKKKKKAKTVSKKTQRKSVVESSESESEAGEIKSEPEEGNCTLLFENLSLNARKPVLGVSDQVRHKPGCTATGDG